jgi:PAS domain S-box-containing protein
VLFAPLNIDGKTIGIMGLANKPTDFTKEDERVSEAFGDLAALALQKWKTQKALVVSEKQLRETIEQSYDGIVITDEKFNIIEWNKAQTRIYGFTSSEMIGTTLTEFHCKNFCRSTSERHIKCEKLRQKILNFKDRVVQPENWELEIQNKTRVARNIQVTAFPIYFGESFLFCQISRDITEEKKLAKMKDRFVSVVTHELRTPLLSIKSSIHLLEESALGTLNEQQSELVSICKRNTNRLTNFINDVLDFQSLKNKDDSMIFYTQDVFSVLQETYDLLKPLAQEKNINFSVECDPLLFPKIDMDRNQIVRLLINISSNAIKYTNEGFVKIKLIPLQEKNKVLIKVIDSGVGIKAEDMDSLFKSFARLSNGKNVQNSSGLGLSIAKKIVEHHNGKIWIESDYGVGSTFFIELPIEQKEISM